MASHTAQVSSIVPPDRPGSVYGVSKLALEWLAAGVLLVLASPLLMLLAALVKATSPGPVIYAQTRLGLYGRPYRIYKFRTMCRDAEAGTGAVWATQRDARITPVGRVLRDLHLDELPQLWNVLRGEMALIGPRPERPEIADRIAARVPRFHERLRVRPGITGLAQMLAPADDPNDVSFEGVRRKLAHDLGYVTSIGFSLDAKIALSTVCHFLAAALDAARQAVLRLSVAAVNATDLAHDGGRDAPELAQLQTA
jgi:lipopolysaccharide/colanic/teichoic acid biosynthesis glycosyltransferase